MYSVSATAASVTIDSIAHVVADIQKIFDDMDDNGNGASAALCTVACWAQGRRMGGRVAGGATALLAGKYENVDTYIYNYDYICIYILIHSIYIHIYIYNNYLIYLYTYRYCVLMYIFIHIFIQFKVFQYICYIYTHIYIYICILFLFLRATQPN